MRLNADQLPPRAADIVLGTALPLARLRYSLIISELSAVRMNPASCTDHHGWEGSCGRANVVGLDAIA
jgi:hypothetical protein